MSRSSECRVRKWTIRSLDRDSGDSHNFTFRLENPTRLVTGGFLRVVAVSLPMSYFTVRSGENSLIPITGVVTTSVNIAQGHYATPTDLAVAVDTALKTADAGFACTYEEERQIFRFTHTTTAYTFTWGSDASTGANAARLLGFAADADSVGTGLVTISSQFPTFGQPLAFDIRSSALTRGAVSGIETGSEGSRSLARVPNAGTRAGYLHWAATRIDDPANMVFRAPEGGTQLDEIDISVWQSSGDFGSVLLDLRGGEIEIELEVAGLE
jgi:hypothetical protein